VSPGLWRLPKTCRHMARLHFTGGSCVMKKCIGCLRFPPGLFGFSLTRAPTPFPPDAKTGRCTRRSLYTLSPLRMSLSCLLPVRPFAMGRVITRLDFAPHTF
jgi:hypothetical protein